MIPRRPSHNNNASLVEEHHKLNLESLESRAQILDGIAITVRALYCAGKAILDSDSLRFTLEDAERNTVTRDADTGEIIDADYPAPLSAESPRKLARAGKKE